MIPRWITAPYRALGAAILDCVLGAEEEFEYRGSTTPERWPPDMHPLDRPTGDQEPSWYCGPREGE